MTKILNLTKPSVLRKQLYQIPIDTDEVYYKLSRLEFLTLLKEFLNGAISERDIEDIIELIECRDGIEFETGNLKESIHLVANHTINGDSLQEVVQKILEEDSY